MKILIIYNEYLYRGGEDIYIESLIKLLRRNGHKVVYFKKSSKSITTFFEKVRVAIGLFYSPKIDQELSIIIKRFRPDIAHFHNVFPLIGATAYRICKKYNIPIIQHVHNYRLVCPKANLYRNGAVCELCPANKNLLISIFYGCYHESRLASIFFVAAYYYHKFIGSYRLINKYIFPSLFTQKYYQTNLALKSKQVVYLPYFVEKISQHITRPVGIPKIYYLYLGRLVPEKGILNLLKSFKKMGKTLVVIGDGPLKIEIYKECEKYKNIVLLPYSDKKTVLSYLKYCRALFIPSDWYEVLPMVYLEAVQLNKKIFLTNNANLITNRFSKKTIYIKPKENIKPFIENKIKPNLRTPIKSRETLTSKFHYTMLLYIYGHV